MGLEIFEEGIKVAIIIIVSIIVYFAIKGIIKRAIFNDRIKDKHRVITMAKLINNIVKYIIIILALLAILSVYGVNTKTFIASLGVAGVLAGLALQDLLKDFIAGVSIVVEDQYNVGDYVTINNFRGQVLSVGLKTTRIKSYDGQILIINNRNITEVINHTKSDPRALIDVSVSYDSDLEKVEKVLTNVCDVLNKKLDYITEDLVVQGVDKLADSAIVYRLVASTEPEMQVPLKREVFREVKIEFDKNKIEIPYNQLVIHNE